MKIKITAKKNKQDGWDVKIKAASYEVVLRFFIISFKKLLEHVDRETAKTFKECMIRTLETVD